MPTTISSLHAREILDSRGNPTVEVDLTLSDGQRVRAAVPSGASTGKREAVELRDGDKQRYNGLGVTRAVANVNGEVASIVTGKDPLSQEAIDTAMIALDGTPNKGRLGANAILGVSLAVLKAGAAVSGLPLYAYIRKTYRPQDTAWILPVPLVNVLNGGQHALNASDFQEYKIVPTGAKSFSEALRWSAEVFHALKKILLAKGLPSTVGDEGGFAPPLATNVESIEVVLEAIEKAGHTPGRDFHLALDPATSSIWENNAYQLKRDAKTLSSAGMIDFWKDWCRRFPILSIEDGLAEDDWDTWKTLMRDLGKTIQIMGDDLFVTNPAIIKKGVADGVANAVLVKVNQIGSVTETVEAVNCAKAAGWNSVISHRSGETEDTTIADLVVGLGTGMIKTGSTSRTDRLVKYNQLLRIEEELGDKATYLGMRAFGNIGG